MPGWECSVFTVRYVFVYDSVLWQKVDVLCSSTFFISLWLVVVKMKW